MYNESYHPLEQRQTAVTMSKTVDYFEIKTTLTSFDLSWWSVKKRHLQWEEEVHIYLQISCEAFGWDLIQIDFIPWFSEFHMIDNIWFDAL